MSVRLKDGTGTDFERASFEQPRGNPLALRDSLATRVAEFLRRRLGSEVLLREQREGTTNADAWALLQQAEQHFQRGEDAMKASDTAAVLREVQSGDTLLAQARALDPAWAAVPVLRGTLAYRASRFFGDDQTKASKWIDIGLAHADTALSLSPANPDALELARHAALLALSARSRAGSCGGEAAARRCAGGSRAGGEDQSRAGGRVGRAQLTARAHR